MNSESDLVKLGLVSRPGKISRLFLSGLIIGVSSF